MKTSPAGREFIQRFEGLRLISYRDTGGVWTIGYGHTGDDVTPGMRISAAEASRLLAADLESAERCVIGAVDIGLTQAQFDALVSFVYNVGCAAFHRSTLLERLNAGEIEAAAAQFRRWVYDNGRIQPGLVTRRGEESELFLSA